MTTLDVLTVISLIVTIISGILAIIAFFFAKDVPRTVKFIIIVLFILAFLAWLSMLIMGKSSDNPNEYVSINNGTYWAENYRPNYLGTDMVFEIEEGQAESCIFQVDAAGTASFQIVHKTTEKNTDGWKFQIIDSENKVVNKVYVPEQTSVTEMEVELEPGIYGAWLQLIDGDMSGEEVRIHTSFRAK